jgi:tryptophan 2,3-dioxygenase
VGSASPSYKGHRYPVEVISHRVWLCFRFPLSFREVEKLMLERGVVVSHETVRLWCAKSGQASVTALRRVTAVIRLLEDHLALLDHLSQSFASFRPLLDNASGAQSSQFMELFQRITAPDCLPTSTTGPGTTPGVNEARERGPADELRALRAAVAQWRTKHLLLVERMIGDEAGTGGTSGLAYLRAQIDLPPHTSHD